MNNMRYLAKDIGNISGEGLGPLAETTSDPAGAVTGAVSSIIGFLTIVAAIWFLIQFLLGGFAWISAGGDKGKLTEAQQKLSNAIIGLTVVVSGWAILALAGQFFGWTNILAPAEFIKSLQFGN